jgi:hypothetical protein
MIKQHPMEIWHIKSKISKYKFLNEFLIIEDYIKGHEFLEDKYQYYSSTDPSNCNVVSKKPYTGAIPESYVEDGFYTELKEKKMEIIKEYSLKDGTKIYYGKIVKTYIIDKSEGIKKTVETLYGIFANNIEDLNFVKTWLMDKGYLFQNNEYTIDGFTFFAEKKKNKYKPSTGSSLKKLFSKP